MTERLNTFSVTLAQLNPTMGDVEISLYRSNDTLLVPAMVPSETPSGVCSGDVDGDGWVGINDFSQMIVNWGSADASSDANCDGMVGIDDLSIVTVNWGACP